MALCNVELEAEPKLDQVKPGWCTKLDSYCCSSVPSVSVFFQLKRLGKLLLHHKERVFMTHVDPPFFFQVNL